MKLIVAGSAGRDLDSIYDYSRAQWGEEQANRYISALWDAFARLGDDPWRGAPDGESRSGYRRLRQGSHFIFYRVHKGVLRIERVLHVRMQASRHIV